MGRDRYTLWLCAVFTLRKRKPALFQVGLNLPVIGTW
jgi:hypothetical protein